MKPWITTACSAALLALGAAAAPSMAQQAQAPAAQQAPAANYSDAQLEKFVSASKKVAVISQEYTPKLQSSTDEATRQEVYREADQKMVDVVRKEGMSVEEFNGINQAIQQDPALMERVQNIAR
ncbi:DUF4168 domain-containing protein [Pusillimonas noertemannii]|uniref:Uncharacterized protein DUF4168 n=1 Tax=Pusillimonas noertemannii TaxID=305977 RepID=A0A2U1CSJ5_9BURK|nr:DUF4168 domain-containing protein [Pusillimonas noertemannii]NYT68127.1 DUF4168 domain-containing protein [Pusillimonas noertemannii]PVY68804.1 uncharacterized protein DUF4168 [Pusillimonas noertemannii]TFL11741.1 DUF4168 domain-containing protein [Pusillimonas noertemannii]